MCCFDSIPIDITRTSCVDVFWNQSYVDLIFFSQSCVDLDFDVIWTTFLCHTLVCPLLGLLGVFVQIVSCLVLDSLKGHKFYDQFIWSLTIRTDHVRSKVAELTWKNSDQTKWSQIRISPILFSHLYGPSLIIRPI